MGHTIWHPTFRCGILESKLLSSMIVLMVVCNLLFLLVGASLCSLCSPGTYSNATGLCWLTRRHPYSWSVFALFVPCAALSYTLGIGRYSLVPQNDYFTGRLSLAMPCVLHHLVPFVVSRLDGEALYHTSGSTSSSVCAPCAAGSFANASGL